MLIKAAKFQLILVVFLVYCGCSSKINVAGCYNSNHSEAGMFGHHIELNSDSSFRFRFAGDMMLEDGKGFYHLKKDTIFLIFNKTVKQDVVSGLSSHTILTKDIKLIYESDKVYFIDEETNKVIKGKESVYIKRKKYILFGGHYVKKRFYMKKIQCR